MTNRSPGRPVQPGEAIALKHGVYSPTLVGTKAEGIKPIITSAAPWTAAPEFAGTLEMYCRALATALLGLAHIEKVTEQKGYGAVPNRLVESVNAMTNTAMRAGTLLGLDPKAKAVIQNLVVNTESSLAGIDRLQETGRAIREKRAAEAPDTSCAVSPLSGPPPPHFADILQIKPESDADDAL